ncbi:class I SAM-dependent methyltransferase [Kordiimonas sediminis]|nr:hypothetical protein [Kordiimonas sediminis]
MKFAKILKTGLLATALMVPTASLLADNAMQSIEEAVKSSHRTAEHMQHDPQRKPAMILEFAGVKPGMTVLDINSGRGYYSEILSSAVGAEGHVIAHNGPVYWAFMKETSPAGLAERENVTEIHNGKEAFDVPENSVDVALNALAYHDYFMSHEASSGELRSAINASLYQAIKPGGVLIVIDHIGVAGADEAEIGKIHRIDPQRVRSELEAAGFEYAGEADFLRNPADSPDKPWFGAEVRYSSDRFVYKFIKK